MVSDSCCSLPIAWDQIQGTAPEIKVSLYFRSWEYSATVHGQRSSPLLAADLVFADTSMGFMDIQLVGQPRPDQFQQKQVVFVEFLFRTILRS